MDLAAAQDFQRLYGSLERATAAEGESGALLASRLPERVLTGEEVDMLGGAAKRSRPSGGPSSGVNRSAGGAAFTSLSTAVSVMLSTAPRTRGRPTTTLAGVSFGSLVEVRSHGLLALAELLPATKRL